MKISAKTHVMNALKYVLVSELHEHNTALY
jgi:hypothetical protein